MSDRSTIIKLINQILTNSKRISELDEITTPTNNDLIEIVQAGVNYKIKKSNLVTGGGASAFTDLTDVPNSYSGEAGKIVQVNATEDGLEFVTSGASFALTDGLGTTANGTAVDLGGSFDAGQIIIQNSNNNLFLISVVDPGTQTGSLSLDAYSFDASISSGGDSNGFFLLNQDSPEISDDFNGKGLKGRSDYSAALSSPADDLYYVQKKYVDDAISTATGGFIDGSGAANRVAFFSDANTLSSSANFLYNGTQLTVSGQATTQSAVSGSTAQFVGVDGNPLRITFDTHNNASGSGTAFMVRRSRGTAGTPAALSSGDVIAAFSGRGYGTSQYAAASTGLINIKANQAFTNTANGTYISFDTTPDGSVTAAEVFRFGPSGQLGIGGANFGTSGQVLVSGGASAAPSWTTGPFWNTSGSTTVTTPTITGKVTWTQAAEASTNTFHTFTQAAHTGGTPTGISYTGGAHTTLTAATETSDISLNLSRTIQFTGGGTFPLQRSINITAPVLAATTSTTITDAITMALRSPTAGTNMTLTNASALAVTDGTGGMQIALNGVNPNFGPLVFGSGGASKSARGSIGPASITSGSFNDAGTAIRFHAATSGATMGAFQFTTFSSVSGNILNSGASIFIDASPNYTQSSSAGAAHSVYRTGFTFTHAGTTGNRITGYLADPTINLTNTNASTVEGFSYLPSVTATNSSSVNKAWRHNSGFIQWESILTPAQITSNQNDYNPTGLNNGGAPHGATIVRLSSDASRDITSIVGGVVGRILILVNVGAQNIVLKDDDGATGTAANRLQLNADTTLLPELSIMLWYDGTSSRWRSMR